MKHRQRIDTTYSITKRLVLAMLTYTRLADGQLLGGHLLMFEKWYRACLCLILCLSGLQRSLQLQYTPVTTLASQSLRESFAFPSRDYSASRGHTGGLSLTWIPPRFFSWLSWNGSFQPPSSSGVLSHSRIRCLLGAGGA